MYVLWLSGTQVGLWSPIIGSVCQSGSRICWPVLTSSLMVFLILHKPYLPQWNKIFTLAWSCWCWWQWVTFRDCACWHRRWRYSRTYSTLLSSLKFVHLRACMTCMLTSSKSSCIFFKNMWTTSERCGNRRCVCPWCTRPARVLCANGCSDSFVFQPFPIKTSLSNNWSMWETNAWCCHNIACITLWTCAIASSNFMQTRRSSPQAQLSPFFLCKCCCPLVPLPTSASV